MVFSTLGNWYLRAFCHLAGAERVFRIDRIRTLEVQDDHFEPPARDVTPEIGYIPAEEDVRAVIRLHDAARWVAAYYPVETVSDGAAGLEVRFSASDASVIARLLLRLGRSAELIEGPEVAERVTELRHRILGRYGMAT